MVNCYRPEIMQTYYYIASDGGMRLQTWLDDEIDNLRYRFGNCFASEEDCNKKLVLIWEIFDQPSEFYESENI